MRRVADYCSIEFRIDQTLADAKWSDPKWPGDGVRSVLFRRDVLHLNIVFEIGEVRIQHYGAGCYMVAAYMPGYETSSPGDTPKMNPDKHEWVSTAESADAVFEEYVRSAARDGWTPLTPTGRIADSYTRIDAGTGRVKPLTEEDWPRSLGDRVKTAADLRFMQPRRLTK